MYFKLCRNLLHGVITCLVFFKHSMPLVIVQPHRIDKRLCLMTSLHSWYLMRDQCRHAVFDAGDLDTVDEIESIDHRQQGAELDPGVSLKSIRGLLMRTIPLPLSHALSKEILEALKIVW
jgi:hypothetical protein